MSNSNLQQLYILCLQMHKEGKTPSVGILRARAPFKVSVTEAIEAIKRFNAHKPKLDVPSEKEDSQQNSTNSAGQVSTLQARVETLEKEVAELKRVLNEVISAK